MNRRTLLAGAASLALAPALARAGAPKPPITPKRPLRIEQLGRVRVDDYAWLKPANWKEVWRDSSRLDPAIRRQLEIENAYADAVLAPSERLREGLLAQMTARLAAEAESPPRILGDWAYVDRFEAGAAYRRHLRRPVAGGPETLLMDEAERAAGHRFFAVVHAGPSPDQSLFTWAEDVSGAEKYTIYLKDLRTGQVTEGPRDAFGPFVVTPDGAQLFWIQRDENSRPSRLYRRPTAGGPDVLVYEETDPAFLTTVTLSRSGRYLFIRCWNDVTAEVRLIDAARPDAPPRLVAARQAGHSYSVEHWGDRFVVLTNADGATDFKLMLAPEGDPSRANWRDWVPAQAGRTIVEIMPFAERLVWIERVEGNPQVVIADRAGDRRQVAFDEPAYLASLRDSDYAGPTLRLTYESPRTPRTWLAVDLTSGERTVEGRQPVGGGFRPEDYEVRRLHARAADGALVPITLLHRKGLKGPAGVVLTGYGSYGASYETGFSLPNLTLADQGWIWAVAHVRGGSEKGRDWFEQARALRKKVSFTDFVACAEHLIAEGLTAKRRIVPHGFSAGGLLVGAALNLRPDLFGAVIGQAPFVDMLNTMSDATHPLVPLTRPVWGDPLADPAAYDYIASYSPYENVRRTAYPPVLATTAVSDDRVGFWEPAKWIAALRERSTSRAPMLLHTEMHGAHGGASGRDAELVQAALIYAFALWACGAPATAKP